MTFVILRIRCDICLREYPHTEIADHLIDEHGWEAIGES